MAFGKPIMRLPGGALGHHLALQVHPPQAACGGVSASAFSLREARHGPIIRGNLSSRRGALQPAS